MHAHVLVIPHFSQVARLTEYHVKAIWTDAKGFRRSSTLVKTRDWKQANAVADVIDHPVPSGNWAAVFAATEARGPRCDHCGSWTFRQEYNRLPYFIARLCPDCLPIPRELRQLKVLSLTQVFKSDIENRDLTGNWPILLTDKDLERRD